MIAVVTCPKKARRAVLFLTEALPSVPWGENVVMETQGEDVRLATCMKAWLRLLGEGRFSLPWSIVYTPSLGGGQVMRVSGGELLAPVGRGGLPGESAVDGAPVGVGHVVVPGRSA